MNDHEQAPGQMISRLFAPKSNNSKVANPKCGDKSCGRSTREGKPYCSDHVEQSPYVAKLIKELSLRDAEADKLQIGGKIEQDSHLVRETMLLLSQCSYTAAKLSRVMDIPQIAAENLIALLHDFGLAIMTKTDRGAIVIRLPDPEPLDLDGSPGPPIEGL